VAIGQEVNPLAVALSRLLTVTEASFEERAQLMRALESRIVIEQAKGMLAERLRLTLDDAFELLRTAARSKRVKLHELAREVIESRETPAAVLGQLETRLRANSGFGSR
jgi:AmiR/NasT family two-component response regulator